VSDKIEEVGTEDDASEAALSRMNPKGNEKAQSKSPGTIDEDNSMGPNTLEYPIGRHKTFSFPNNSMKISSSIGSHSSPRLVSTKKQTNVITEIDDI
jgi:hypothetical protein